MTRRRILSTLYTLTLRPSLPSLCILRVLLSVPRRGQVRRKDRAKFRKIFASKVRFIRKTLRSQIPLQVYLEAATPNTISPKKRSPESSHGTKSYVGSKLTSILPATVARSQKTTDAKRGKHLLVCPSDGKFYVPDYPASLP